jgi:hypothetical protein
MLGVQRESDPWLHGSEYRANGALMGDEPRKDRKHEFEQGTKPPRQGRPVQGASGGCREVSAARVSTVTAMHNNPFA